MEKNLSVTIELDSNNTFRLMIREPESGDCVTINCHDRGETVEAENDRIVNEIRSWVSLMRDEANFNDGSLMEDLLMEQKEQM